VGDDGFIETTGCFVTFPSQQVGTGNLPVEAAHDQFLPNLVHSLCYSSMIVKLLKEYQLGKINQRRIRSGAYDGLQFISSQAEPSLRNSIGAKVLEATRCRQSSTCHKVRALLRYHRKLEAFHGFEGKACFNSDPTEVIVALFLQFSAKGQ